MAIVLLLARVKVLTMFLPLPRVLLLAMVMVAVFTVFLALPMVMVMPKVLFLEIVCYKSLVGLKLVVRIS